MSSLTCCLLLTLGMRISPLTAQEVATPEKTIAIRTITHAVTDERGNPIVGASVVTIGLRAVGSGAWIPWPEHDLKIAELVTNEAGKVDVPYPVEFTGFSKRLQVTEAIILETSHNLYVTAQAEREVAVQTGRQTLLDGSRTKFTCVDSNGASVDKFGVLIAGAGARAIWSLKEGELTSGGVPNGSMQTMLVGIGHDGLPQFSGVLPTRYAKGKDTTIRGVTLRPGIRVEGKLSPNVPKPVRDGEVIAWCLPMPTKETDAEKKQMVVGWMDQAIIDADGNFVFQSLPRSGSIQLIALCRGFMVSPNGRNSPNGITIEVGDALPNDTLQVEVPMAEAGTVEVLVLGPDGKPLSDATVSTWPNTSYNLMSNQLLGQCEPTIHRIKYQMGIGERPAFNSSFKNYSPRYVTKTDLSGKATLREVPLGKNQVFVAFPGMLDSNAIDNPEVLNQGIEVNCNPSKPVELTVRMVAQ